MGTYEIIILWSEDDNAYVALIPEFLECKAYGKTPRRALANALDAMAVWRDAAREFGDPMPKLRRCRLFMT